jgi:hypothetical protein
VAWLSEPDLKFLNSDLIDMSGAFAAKLDQILIAMACVDEA